MLNLIRITRPLSSAPGKIVKFVMSKKLIMAGVETKKKDAAKVKVAKKMKDYSDDPAFKKKAESAVEFLKKNGKPGARKSGK